MTASDDDRQPVREGLIASLNNLGVLSRMDEDGRILVFIGKTEYEVTVDLSRLLSKWDGGRKIVLGKSSLLRLAKGDIKELFPAGIVARGDDADVPIKTAVNYSPLQWDSDLNNVDDEENLSAQGDDWTYHISPIRGDHDEVLGYRVSGGDYESGDEFGSSLIDGEPGELTLAEAKAAADANYSARYLEAEGLLGDVCKQDKVGKFICHVGLPGIDKVEVVATLADEQDSYDGNGTVTVCLRTILSCSGDPSVLKEEVLRIMSGN